MEKRAKISTFLKITIIIVIVVLIVLVWFLINFYSNKNQGNFYVLENPLKAIILANIDKEGRINQTAVIEQGIINFNETYINYILIALETSALHKSPLGSENPMIELVIDDEIWSSEISNSLITKKTPIDNKDLRIKMSKEEAVKALLSNDIKQFMKDSVSSGRTQIETVAGKVELFSKGYLDMYKSLTGKEAEI